MSKIKNGGLDQYGAEPFKKQQFRTVGIEGLITGALELIVELNNRSVNRYNSPVNKTMRPHMHRNE